MLEDMWGIANAQIDIRYSSIQVGETGIRPFWANFEWTADSLHHISSRIIAVFLFIDQLPMFFESATLNANGPGAVYTGSGPPKFVFAWWTMHRVVVIEYSTIFVSVSSIHVSVHRYQMWMILIHVWISHDLVWTLSSLCQFIRLGEINYTLHQIKPGTAQSQLNNYIYFMALTSSQ